MEAELEIIDSEDNIVHFLFLRGAFGVVDFGVDDDEGVFLQGDPGFIGAQPAFAVGYVEEFGTVVGVEDAVPVGAEGGGGYVAEVLVGLVFGGQVG